MKIVSDRGVIKAMKDIEAMTEPWLESCSS